MWTISEFADDDVMVCLCRYAGLVFASAVLGPVVAFICGGFLLHLYTHFDTIDISTSVYMSCSSYSYALTQRFPDLISVVHTAFLLLDPRALRS